MREKIEVTLDELETLMSEKKTITKKEACLTLMAAFLSGMVLGIFLSPKKRVMIGSNNGNNNIAASGRHDAKECDQEKKKCSQNKKECNAGKEK